MYEDKPSKDLYGIYCRILKECHKSSYRESHPRAYFLDFLTYTAPAEEALKIFSYLSKAVKECGMTPDEAKLYIILWLGAHPDA